jgi:hypothetical protein
MCGKEAMTNEGVIYVRAEIKGKWGNHVICLDCWTKNYRKDSDMSREPYNALKDPGKYKQMASTYTPEQQRLDLNGLIELELIIENPENDFHLTTKGKELAFLIKEGKPLPVELDLCIMQKKLLEALYSFD